MHLEGAEDLRCRGGLVAESEASWTRMLACPMAFMRPCAGCSLISARYIRRRVPEAELVCS